MNGPPEPGNDRDGYPVGRQRQRVQSQLFSQVKNVPGLADTRLEESEAGIDHQIVADVETMTYADGVVPADDAGVQLNWWPNPGGEDYFQFHYWDGSGVDCGWHRQPNDHVDGLDHYQVRASSEDEYGYEAVAFAAESPTGTTWEVLGERLPSRLHDLYGRE